jgi:hypothetical protein
MNHVTKNQYYEKRFYRVRVTCDNTKKSIDYFLIVLIHDLFIFQIKFNETKQKCENLINKYDFLSFVRKFQKQKQSITTTIT